MKHFLLLLYLGCCLSSIAWSQTVSADETRLYEYMSGTYGITIDQFKAYMKISSDFDRKSEELENSRISADTFRKKKRQLYDEYYNQVKKVFNDEQFFDWSTCLERLDRYRYLSERLFVPRNRIRALYKTEREWGKDREDLWNSNMDESMKHQKKAELLSALQERICQILGNETANVYSEYKAMENLTHRNMKKYSASYNEAMKIAEIEKEYKHKRQVLNADKNRRRTDIDADITECEKLKDEAIRSALPDDVYERWKTINDNMLDYTLKSMYGMDKRQIAEYKNAYNSYVLEEYFILNSKEIPIQEKEAMLDKANDNFCEKVRSFAPANTYRQWLGRRQYVFERRMAQKGIRQ